MTVSMLVTISKDKWKLNPIRKSAIRTYPRTIQQTGFTGNPIRAGDTALVFVIEKTK